MFWRSGRFQTHCNLYFHSCSWETQLQLGTNTLYELFCNNRFCHQIQMWSDSYWIPHWSKPCCDGDALQVASCPLARYHIPPTQKPVRTGLYPCRKSQNHIECSLTAFAEETLGNSSLSISQVRPSTIISNMTADSKQLCILRTIATLGLYLLVGGGNIQNPFFFFSGNITVSVLDIVFYQESDAFFLFPSPCCLISSSQNKNCPSFSP